jgi:aminomethyltransferase
MAKRTPLFDRHLAAGARMVDFAGWDMPLHYGSQIDEHHAVRRAAGVFDVSHMLMIDLHGAGTRALLRRLLANNIDKLRSPGRALYTCLLRPDGGVLDDLIAYFLDESDFRLVVNAATADKDLAWIGQQAASDRVGVEPRRDLALLAVQGPQARERVWQALPQLRTPTEGLKPFWSAVAPPLFAARTGYTGEDGFELAVPSADAPAVWDALIAAGVHPAGLGARDTLRLEAGMNLYGQDMDESVNPLESGLAWTVDLTGERDFIGKSALLACRVARKLTGLLLADKGVLRAHQTVHTGHGEGTITSGGFSPTLNRSIALARLPAEVAVQEAVEVDVRGRRLQALVVAPPFVRQGRILIKL